MNVLLDTRLLLWAAGEPEKLTVAARGNNKRHAAPRSRVKCLCPAGELIPGLEIQANTAIDKAAAETIGREAGVRENPIKGG